MIFTTRAKIFLKKYSPKWLFSIIRLISDNTILKIIPLLFKHKTMLFKEKIIKEISYGNRKFKIIIDPKNGYLDAQIYANGLYEPHIVSEIIANISSGNTCLDIGANIGHHTIIMSQCAGDTGKVFAYEPIPKISKQMGESLELNNIKNVTILSDALSNKEGNLALHLGTTNIGASSLIGEGSDDTIAVSVKTLDQYNYKKIDFIKIDVEGYEYNVLLGGEKTIKQSRPKIIFEYSPIYYRKYNPAHIKDLLNFFQENNYEMIDLEDHKKIISNTEEFINEFNEGLRSQTNILALPR